LLALIVVEPVYGFNVTPAGTPVLPAPGFPPVAGAGVVGAGAVGVVLGVGVLVVGVPVVGVLVVGGAEGVGEVVDGVVVGAGVGTLVVGVGVGATVGEAAGVCGQCRRLGRTTMSTPKLAAREVVGKVPASEENTPAFGPAASSPFEIDRVKNCSSTEYRPPLLVYETTYCVPALSRTGWLNRARCRPDRVSCVNVTRARR
jgi:hypothetical protein